MRFGVAAWCVVELTSCGRTVTASSAAEHAVREASASSNCLRERLADEPHTRGYPCATRGRWTWALEPGRNPPPTAFARSAACVPLDIVWYDGGHSRMARRLATPAAPCGDYTAVRYLDFVAQDFDLDGLVDVAWRMAWRSRGGDVHEEFVAYRLAGNEIEPATFPWHFTALRDVDNDGDLDGMLSFSGKQILPCPGRMPYPVTGPSIVVYYTATGGFSLDDPMTRASAARVCSQNPYEIAKFEEGTIDDELSSRNVVCAALFGRTAADVHRSFDAVCRPTAFRRTCEDTEPRPGECPSRGVYERWVENVPPIFGKRPPTAVERTKGQNGSPLPSSSAIEALRTPNEDHPLDVADLHRRIEPAQSGFRACYEQVILKKSPTVSIDLRVRLMLDGHGRLDRARVEGPTRVDDEFVSCVMSVLYRSWERRPPAANLSDERVVVLPLKFVPSVNEPDASDAAPTAPQKPSKRRKRSTATH